MDKERCLIGICLINIIKASQASASDNASGMRAKEGRRHRCDVTMIYAQSQTLSGSLRWLKQNRTISAHHFVLKPIVALRA